MIQLDSILYFVGTAANQIVLQLAKTLSDGGAGSDGDARFYD